MPSATCRDIEGSTCSRVQRKVSGTAFSHRLHDRQLSSMAGARWLRQRSNARKCEFAMKALTVWRAVPPCCHAVLAQSMRAQHASNTTARANYHTHLPSFKRPAITFGRTSGWRRRRWNQSSEGRVGRVFTGREVALDVSSLGRPHRARPSTRRGNTLSVDGNRVRGSRNYPLLRKGW